MKRGRLKPEEFGKQEHKNEVKIEQFCNEIGVDLRNTLLQNYWDESKNVSENSKQSPDDKNISGEKRITFVPSDEIKTLIISQIYPIIHSNCFQRTFERTFCENPRPQDHTDKLLNAECSNDDVFESVDDYLHSVPGASKVQRGNIQFQSCPSDESLANSDSTSESFQSCESINLNPSFDSTAVISNKEFDVATSLMPLNEPGTRQSVDLLVNSIEIGPHEKLPSKYDTTSSHEDHTSKIITGENNENIYDVPKETSGSSNSIDSSYEFAESVPPSSTSCSLPKPTTSDFDIIYRRSWSMENRKPSLNRKLTGIPSAKSTSDLRSGIHEPTSIKKCHSLHTLPEKEESCDHMNINADMTVSGFAISPDGNIIIVSNESKVCRIYHKDRTYTDLGNLKSPWDVAVGKQQSTVYISDQEKKHGKIREYSISGLHVKDIGGKNMKSAKGLAVSEKGHVRHVYVCDDKDRCVYVFDVQEKKWKVIMKFSRDQSQVLFRQPFYISVGCKDNCYVTDDRNVIILDSQTGEKINRYTGRGRLGSLANESDNHLYGSLPSFRPSRCCVYDGYAYVIDKNKNVLHKILQNGEVEMIEINRNLFPDSSGPSVVDLAIDCWGNIVMVTESGYVFTFPTDKTR